MRVVVALFGLALVGCGSTPRLDPVERIVLVTFDTTRADRLGCYGYADASTPNLDGLAREGVLFEQAVSPAPTTLPSHATMFTGLYPQDHGVRYNLTFRLGPSAKTLAESLHDAGFETAAFPASGIVSRRFGLAQGFDVYHEPSAAMDRPSPNHPEHLVRRAADGVDLALRWLGEQEGKKSFLWLHFYDPHSPHAPPFPYSAEFRDRPYDGEIAYADAQIGRLLERLRQEAAWARTLVVVAGDHGEGLFDHDERLHLLLTYESTMRVPLIVRAPGAEPSRVTEAVTLADLTPTVLDLAGVAAPAGMRGISLRPALEGGELPRRGLYFESLAGALTYGWQELRGLRDGRWKLIDSEDPELYDLAADPDESDNLAAREPRRLEDMRRALDQLGLPVELGVLAGEADAPALDAETEALLSGLGYIGGGSGGPVASGAPHPRRMVLLQPELLAAQAVVAQRDWDRLEAFCSELLERDPGNKWALTNLSRALRELRRADESLVPAMEYVHRYAADPDGYILLARSYRAKGDPQAALEVLERGRAAVPQSEPLAYLRLVAAFDAERLSTCSDDVSATLREFPGSGRLLVLEARCAMRAGDLDAALATLKDAVAHGFREIRKLKETEDFAALADRQEFQRLLAAEGDRDDGVGPGQT